MRYATQGVPDIAFGVGGVSNYPLPLAAGMSADLAMLAAIDVATDARGRLLIGGDVNDGASFGSAWYGLRISGDTLLIDGFE